MPTIRLKTLIHAPIDRCFDLSLDIDIHRQSTSKTRERAIAGVMTGQMKLGDTVTWEAVHFGVKQRLTSKITRYERPFMFEDSMVQGAFHSFTHVHRFHPSSNGTLMTDVFKYKSPLGPLGVVADKLFLERYMRQFLRERALFIKQVAEQEVHQ